MPTITQKIEFDAGHRILNHESKCANLHGHRYVALITVHSEGLDKLDRVVDFEIVKETVKQWIDKHWDHTVLFHASDPLIEPVMKEQEKKVFIFPDYKNPTAEVMAEHLYRVCAQLLDGPLTVKKVKLYETPNCSAEYPDS